jgi:ligand-binding SRPBCC domain-containing protein
MGAVPLRWREQVESYSPDDRYTVVQLDGPYRSWWHEHRFREEAGRTVVEERVLFAGHVPALSQALFVAPMLKRLFAYRAFAARLRFGERPQPAAWPRPVQPAPEAHPE